MTDGVFFLKAAPPKGMPAGVKGIGLDPVAAGFGCGGADAYCSTAYGQLWSALKSQGGVRHLRDKYGIDGKLAFVSFSAGHGLLNPLLASDPDRAATDAVVLLDSTFGGGKLGYVKAAQAAANGGPLLVSVTSDKGTTDALTNGDYAWQRFVLEPAGLKLDAVSTDPPLPEPAEGAFRKENLWYYRYSDAQYAHQNLGKLLSPVLEARLWPYFTGGGASAGRGVLLAGAGLGAAYLLYRWWRRTA